jgi:ABC-type thiamin/hydroxymethylpyrimidine transport system permease subunit
LISLPLTTLAIPTVILGPPGVYKILLGLYMGIIFELLLLIFQYKRWSYVFGLAFTFAASVPMEYYLFKILGLPAAEQIKPMILAIIVVYFVNGLLGSWLGMKFYHKKIKKLQVVQMWEKNNESKNS